MSGIAGPRLVRGLICISVILVAILAGPSLARNPYRKAFFQAYPSARGSVLDDAPSHSGHCGVCHYDFGGGGPKNAFGIAVEATDRSKDAILGLGGFDPDGDGFTNETEIADTAAFSNTPTFPGLTPANIGNVSNVDTADIQNHLVPSTGSDTTPPSVTVIVPNGGETYIDNAFNEGHDDSDAVFTIESPVGGTAPTTLRDFD